MWHGANWHFVIWGILNGGLVVIGRILKPYKEKFYTRIKVDENVESIKFCKRAIVFWLITLTWVLFNNGINESLYIIKKMILFNPIHFFDDNLFSIAGTVATTFVTIISTVVFCKVQRKRVNEREEYKKFNRQPVFLQSLVIAMMICVCIFGACSTDATINTQFLYFQF